MRAVNVAEVPAVAPVAVAAGEGAASLFTLLLWGIALSLLLVWRHTLGALFQFVADEMDKVAVSVFGRTRHLLGPVSAALRAADDAIQTALASTAKGAEHATVYLYNHAWHTLEWTAREIWKLGYATGAALEGLVHGTIPRLVRAGTFRLEHRFAQLRTAVLHVEQALARPLTRALHRMEAALEHDFGIARRGIDATRRDLGRAERALERQAARLGKVEALLGVAAFSALLVRALSRLGLKWLRCGNVNRVGRQLCGMNPSLLESLLADALLVGGALSLVELAEEMQTVVGDSAGLIQRFWRAA